MHSHVHTETEMTYFPEGAQLEADINAVHLPKKCPPVLLCAALKASI